MREPVWHILKRTILSIMRKLTGHTYACCETLKRCSKCEKVNQKHATDRMPTIEVVRCKECKWFRDAYFISCELTDSPMTPESFCSRGERKTE